MDFNISSHNCRYDNISSKFDFQGPGLMVKVDILPEIFLYHMRSNPSQPENLNVYNTVTFMSRSLYDRYIKVAGFFVPSFT